MIDDIRLVQPIVRLRRNADGWNVAHLVKEQASEADREGPARPLQISSISIADGVIEIDDRTGGDGQAVRLPRRIARIDFKGAFSYEPVNFTLRVGRLSFQSASPSIALNSLTGAVSVRGDDLHFERVSAQTAQSSLEVEGMVRNYLGTPVANATMRSARLRLPEFEPFVPALEGINLSPAFELKVAGPASGMRTDLHVRTEAGTIDGQVTSDVLAPGRSIRGELEVANLDASRALSRLPSTRVNGRTTFDLTLRDDETVRGTARVGLENTVAAGYAIDRLAGDSDARRRSRSHRRKRTRLWSRSDRQGRGEPADRRASDDGVRRERTRGSSAGRAAAACHRPAAHRDGCQRAVSGPRRRHSHLCRREVRSVHHRRRHRPGRHDRARRDRRPPSGVLCDRCRGSREPATAGNRTRGCGPS